MGAQGPLVGRTPAGRYRSPRGSGRLGVGGYLLLAVGMAVGIAVAVVLALQSTTSVQAGLRGFVQVSGRGVQITFDVRKPAAATAQCAVRARDVDGAEVGRATVTVKARTDGKTLTTVRYTLPTTRPAVTGEVTGCRLTADG